MIGCGGQLKEATLDYIELDTIEDGDTILLKKNAENLTSWLIFYGEIDSSFKLSNFKSSGVILHLNDLQGLDSTSGGNHELNNLFSYSPDKKKYIDLFSYGYIISKSKTDSNHNSQNYFLVDGEADQQIVLGEVNGKLKELMFNGPSQIVETADWINNEQFLITMISNEENKIIAEVFLFDIKKKIFTNYRLNHYLSPEVSENSFFDFWQKTRTQN